MNYNESSMECSFIQNLLYNFHIPTIKILKDRKNLLDGQHYIYKNAIYTHIKDGEEDVYLSSFTPGKKVLGLTRNHISESNNYNTNLHEALGNYLRFIRDYYDVDLMPMYNCFSNRFIDTFSLPIIEERRQGSVIKSGYKLFAFPARYGCEYSIFCKNNASAQVQLAFFNGKKPLEINASDNKWIQFEPSIISLSQWEALSPYKVPSLEEISSTNTSDNDDKTKQILLHNEVNLYLFVQLPEQNAENLVVIENNSSKVVNNSLINHHLQQPFSDKLLGYLLNYYITPLDPIDENIANIQKMLSSKEFVIKDVNGNEYGKLRLKNFEKGVFDYPTKSCIYNLYRLRNIEDFTGYVDKDVESLIIQDFKQE